MIRGTAQLRPDLVGYDDLLKLAFAANDVDHQVEVDMSVRVWRGRKIRLWRYKKCIQWGRFTCDGIKGSSKGTTFYPIQLLFMRLFGIYEIYLIIFVLSFFDHLGTNHVIVVLQASNVLTECIGDQEHLTFKVDVQVTDTAEDKTYAPITANHKRCDSRILGMSVFNVKATHYANQYFQKNKFRELRETKLVRELENKLQAKLGSTVSIPITTSGKPRSCRRFKRFVGKNERCTKQKTCPNGFTRMGNEDKCGKYFGFQKPNCSTYGPNATVFIKSFGGRSLYWCTTPMA